MKIQQQIREKPLECPVPHKSRPKLMNLIKRVGIFGFFFFLIKGLLWIAFFYFGFDVLKDLFN